MLRGKPGFRLSAVPKDSLWPVHAAYRSRAKQTFGHIQRKDKHKLLVPVLSTSGWSTSRATDPPESFFGTPHAQIWPHASGHVGFCPQPRPMLLIWSSTEDVLVCAQEYCEYSVLVEALMFHSHPLFCWFGQRRLAGHVMRMMCVSYDSKRGDGKSIRAQSSITY